MTKEPAVYILASQRNGVLYTGVTSDLVKRVWEHREKLLKRWRRAWKLRLIEETNPDWNDLYETLLQ